MRKHNVARQVVHAYYGWIVEDVQGVLYVRRRVHDELGRDNRLPK